MEFLNLTEKKFKFIIPTIFVGVVYYEIFYKSGIWIEGSGLSG